MRTRTVSLTGPTYPRATQCLRALNMITMQMLKDELKYAYEIVTRPAEDQAALVWWATVEEKKKWDQRGGFYGAHYSLSVGHMDAARYFALLGRAMQRREK